MSQQGNDSQKRQSVMLQPGSLPYDFGDLSDDEGPAPAPASAPVARSRQPQPQRPIQDNHRPLVGGFAAAAYEAARNDFMRKKAAEEQKAGNKRN